MEKLKVKVADFEGPFDLLLHLIKKHKMDIYNVEIYKITNQYLSYLEEMKIMDLEITSEFIVVAATLIEIKSKKLLPKIKVEQQESEEDIEKNLMEKLIEYKKIKHVSEFFKEKYTSAGDVYSKKPEIIEEVVEKNVEDMFKNITLLDLYRIYNKVLESYSLKQNIENIVEKKIYVDKYKVEDKMNDIISEINTNNILRFEVLIQNSTCKLETVVIFLALLELIKLRVVSVYQDISFDSILIKRRNDNE